MLSPVHAALIVEFMAGCEFNVGEFLSWEMKKWVVGGEKLLLVYSCLIMQLCLAGRVQKLSGIDEMIEAINTTNLGFIIDATNPLSRKAWRGADMLAKIYQKSSQTEATETTDAIEVGGQIKTV